MTSIDTTERDDLAETLNDAVEVFYEPFDWHESTRIAARILTAGYRKPRTITTVEELDALPDGSAILDGSGDVAQKLSGWWHFPETSPMGSSKVVKCGPVAVLHEPEAKVAA